MPNSKPKSSSSSSIARPIFSSTRKALASSIKGPTFSKRLGIKFFTESFDASISY
jgi:hypothetical protein